MASMRTSLSASSKRERYHSFSVCAASVSTTCSRRTIPFPPLGSNPCFNMGRIPSPQVAKYPFANSAISL